MKKKKELHDEIARAAYEFHKTRDGDHGHDLDDWFKAEKIVMEKHERHAKEIGQEDDIITKEGKGFPRTVKKGGHGYSGYRG
ncbi:MAG: hypothetical protein A2X59_07095 [Nitrospirae bacterium GWC2_42_7]|nr:MAG: hypothetical protein A2X59_07095 [Nitrospirae bacterium GWC2_42_7]